MLVWLIDIVMYMLFGLAFVSDLPVDWSDNKHRCLAITFIAFWPFVILAAIVVIAFDLLKNKVFRK